MLIKLIVALKEYRFLVVIVVMMSVVFLLTLSKDKFLEWDECIYAQESVEMQHSGNWITNQWDHIVLWEKPPLTNNIISAFTVFGINEFSSRLPIFLISLLTVILLYIFCKQFFSETTAIYSSLLLLVSKSFITYSHRLNSDITFTLFTFAGFFLWVKAKPKLKLLAGFLFGLAVLSKGWSIVPYLLALGIGMGLNYKKGLWKNYLYMILIFLATVLPWHLYEYIRYGQQFIQVYFIEHLLRRASQPLDFHYEGRLFYLKEIWSNFTMWNIFWLVLPLSYLLTIRQYINLKAIKKELQSRQLIFLILLMVVIPLISITNVKTRIWWYLLPVIPFIAIFLGYSIDQLLGKINSLYPKRNSSSSLLSVGLIILFLVINIYFVWLKELSFFSSDNKLNSYNQIFSNSKQYPEKEINYLVWHGERTARSLLPDNLHTSTTFVFGGNPCAVYYSQKHINYFYSVEEFQQALRKQSGLFAFEKSDIGILKNVHYQVLQNTPDYMLIRR